MAAAIVGGAAATAGVLWGARAIGRRNVAGRGPLNAAMGTAITAAEVSRGKGKR